jgi:biotin carboxylase
MLVEVRNSLQELQWILGFLCAEAREHFDFLSSSNRCRGAQGRGVQLQEFLEGTEYIVDHVSCDGVHKTTMLWMHDFQEVNGHRVCIAQRPVPFDSSAMAELVAYTRQCLNALGVRNGATHTEVMWTSGGPCLVEVHTGGSQGKDRKDMR